MLLAPDSSEAYGSEWEPLESQKGPNEASLRQRHGTYEVSFRSQDLVSNPTTDSIKAPPPILNNTIVYWRYIINAIYKVVILP